LEALPFVFQMIWLKAVTFLTSFEGAQLCQGVGTKKAQLMYHAHMLVAT